MKINQKILSIPPYVSTSWKNVISLHKNGDGTLIIGLVNGSTIEVPSLGDTVLEEIFAAHEKFMEQDQPKPNKRASQPASPFPGNLGADAAILNLPLGFEGTVNQLLQHDPASSDSPDLPKEMLERVGSLSKAIGIDSSQDLPKPEPHCNCMYCQLMRVMRDGVEEEASEPQSEEEEVSAEDLRFRDWDIEQVGDKLYKVANPLNQEESYTVFLGNPVGCTCGEQNCEHIRSVLNS